MMTLAEIRDASVSLPVCREAYEQAAIRLADVLDTKKTHEQKAYALFTGYVTLTLALLGAAGAIYSNDTYTVLSIALGVAGAAFALGAICFVLSLDVNLYGAAGSDPSMWLVKGTVDGDQDHLARMLACITFHHQKRIDQSIRSNERKAGWIKVGIILGAAGPFLLAFVFLICA
jgi:hypothetical protein